jgi:hypothetical protein
MVDNPQDDAAALEAFVEQYVQEAIQPYQRAFAPEVLASFEDELRCFLLTHPAAFRKLARLRPRGALALSGEVLDDMQSLLKKGAAG